MKLNDECKMMNDEWWLGSRFIIHHSAFIIFIGALFFLPFLGSVHLFDWDEINFAEMAREMILTKDFLRPQINFETFWEKPPLFIWLQVLAMKMFGISEFSARFPNAVCGILTLLLLKKWGEKMGGSSFGWLWSLAFFGSILPHVYFKSGIIDPVFNLLIFSSFYFLYYQKGWLAGLLLGLAVLTKGPVAALIFGLVFVAKNVLDFFEKRRLEKKEFSDFLKLILAATATAGAWFLVDFLKNGPFFTLEFLTYQIRLFQTKDAGHGGFFGYHFLVLLVGCFPASVFAILGFYRKDAGAQRFQNDSAPLRLCGFERWMACLFWVVLILFSLVQTKIIHYSSLCYFPLTFFAAKRLNSLRINELRLSVFEKCGLALLAFLLSAAVFLVPFLGRRPDVLKSLASRDAFARANFDAAVDWHFWLSAIGASLLIGVVFGLHFFSKKRFWPAVAAIFGGSAIFTASVLAFFVPRIEAITQGAAIEFYQKKASENDASTDLGPHRFKSFAHLFYGQKMPPKKEEVEKAEPTKIWRVARIDRADDLLADSTWTELYRKNGFLFFEKKSAK